MLEAPNEGDWGLTVQEEYFDFVRDAGFDFVRLPVRWFAHTTYVGYDDGGTSYLIDPEFFARVDEVIGWALDRGLAIIIDFHHYEEIMNEPHLERFLFIWDQIAEHYKDYPPQVMFELLNEPNGNLTAPLWNLYAHYALEVIRGTNPTRDVIIGPVNWNSYFWVTTLDVPNDPHVIMTFHYSDSFHLTYRSTDGQAWFGDIWPNNEERKREITRDFDLVADWAQRHDVRILLGEFGVYNKADRDSLVHWTEFVRSEAERHNFAWAYWEFGSGFGVYDPNSKERREDLLRVLIP
jgi:endoglucanase